MGEPIIVDGVDVSRCLHFNECDGSCLLRANSPKIKIFCKLYSDCYHKRYQHKIEECEKLKNKLQIAMIALEDISQYGIDDCPYCEEKIIKAIDTLKRIKE